MSMLRRGCGPGVLCAMVAGLLLAQPAMAANQLLNPGFDIPGGFGATNYVGTGSLGPSAAADWSVWNNSLAANSTDLLPSTDPLGSGFMLSVRSGGAENGVYQFVGRNTVAQVSVDVYVIAGTFELGLGQAGGYLSTATTSVHDQWVHLTASTGPAGGGFAFPGEVGNEIFLYSTGGAAAFFVDNAYAGPVPEASSWATLLAGFAGLGLIARARRCPAARSATAG